MRLKGSTEDETHDAEEKGSSFILAGNVLRADIQYSENKSDSTAKNPFVA